MPVIVVCAAALLANKPANKPASQVFIADGICHEAACQSCACGGTPSTLKSRLTSPSSRMISAITYGSDIRPQLTARRIRNGVRWPGTG
jgi:hypothetical protein